MYYCNYYYFLNLNFRSQPKVCDGCYNLMQNAIIFNDFAIVSVKENDYRIIFWCVNKEEAINIMKNSDFL